MLTLDQKQRLDYFAFDKAELYQIMLNSYTGMLEYTYVLHDYRVPQWDCLRDMFSDCVVEADEPIIYRSLTRLEYIRRRRIGLNITVKTFKREVAEHIQNPTY